MKHFKGLIAVFFVLMSISHAGWSFSLGFESSNPGTIINLIQNYNAFVYLALFFGLGIMLAFTPCVLPMVPILSGIIVGQRSLSGTQAVKLSISYVLGMAVTYATAGLLAGYMGSTVQTLLQQPIVIIAFSCLFLLMAISMWGFFDLRLPNALNNRLQILCRRNNKPNYASVALMGIISTLVVSPCVTAPLIAVLSYIAQSGQAMKGGLILFVMALGMGLPLILVGAGHGSLLPKVGPWMTNIKRFFALIMIAMAIWMLGRILPESLTQLLWAGLLIIGSISLGTLKTASTKSGHLLKGFGVLLIISGAIIGYSAVPMINTSMASPKAPFIKVDNLQDIEKQIIAAKQQGKPVFLEFYASWCSDCQEMETKVFNQSTVAQAMNGLVNLKVNIGDNTAEVARIKKAFAIYGTPTMLFYNNKGEALPKLSLVGYVNKQTLLEALDQVKLS